MTQKNDKIITSDEEIDLITLAKTIWEGRKILFRTVIICGLMGLMVALFSPKEYTASMTMVPQMSEGSSNMGGLSSLAAMAGFKLDMGQGRVELSPAVYPQIVESVPFHLEIMNTKFNFPAIEHPVSIYDYYTSIHKPGIFGLVKKYTIGLPGVLMEATKGKTQKDDDHIGSSELISLSKEENEIRELLSESISLEVDDKDGCINLSAHMMDPQLAAELTSKVQELLQEYIITFKLEKSTAQLDFIKERYNEKKADFERTQVSLAAFRDKNKNITNAIALTEETKLQNEYRLAFEVFSELAKQLEQAQIKVKEDTPVFSIIKPVSIPFKKSKPKRVIIIIIWVFLGGIVGTAWIFAKQFMSTLKSQWINN